MAVTKILITGATGFVGKVLCEHLAQLPFHIQAVVRRAGRFSKNISVVTLTLDEDTPWESVLSDVDVVIHLAGRAHVMHETSKNPYEAFEAINVKATQHLVKCAAEAGVERFIYLSSVKVCGEHTFEQPFDEKTDLAPEDDYAITKAKAESVIKDLSSECKMDYVIIRPPLVYGANVKANFKRLVSLSKSRMPIPLGGVQNLRSLIYLGNLIDFIAVCIHHPEAKNQTFFVSDDQDISTSDLIRLLGKAQNVTPKLIAIPNLILKLAIKLIRPSLYNRLCGNLQVDISKAKTLLGWKPPFSVSEGLNKMLGDACD